MIGLPLIARERIRVLAALFPQAVIDKAIGDMKACNAFEKSRTQYKLLFPAKG
jgi:hypothetical protein